MKRKMNLILLLTAAVMLLFTCFAYAAGGNGSISVVLKTSKENPLPEGKYSVALYRIGDEDPDAEAGWSLLSPFDSLQISAGMKAEDLRALAEKAAGIIAGQHIASTGSKEAVLTEAAGFGQLDTGIYLGLISTDVEGLTIQPFVVGLSGQKSEQEVNPKFIYEAPPTPTPTPTPTPEETPTPEPTPEEIPTPEPTPVPTPEPTPEAHPYTLTIHYIYKTGEPAFPTYQHIHWPGEEYDVYSPNLPGYYCTLPRVNGIMPARDIVYTVIYIPRGERLITLDEYETPLGLGNIQMHVGVCYE